MASSSTSFENPINLSGLYLTSSDSVIFSGAPHNLSHCSTIEKIHRTNFDFYTYITKQYMWHLKDKSIGFYADIDSAYIPHRLSLWDLAPKKGKGATVVVLDTGVAAFEAEGDSKLIKHQHLSFKSFNPYENYNCCSQGLQTFIAHINNYLKKPIINEGEIIPLIIDYCLTKKNDRLISFLKRSGKEELLDSMGNLSCNGTRAVHELTQGRKGILPGGRPRFFTLVQLMHPLNKNCIAEFLPCAYGAYDLQSQCTLSHGTHIYGLINSQDHNVCGMAPEATVIMLKVCNEMGITDVNMLIYALKKARSFKADIINMSLKIETPYDDTISKALEDYLKRFEFVVASSGNDSMCSYDVKEAYPDYLALVPFDVGAFLYDGVGYKLCPFSQYSKNKGPKIVAPGLNIVSTALPSSRGEYLFLSGTSMATAIISGFLALLKAEFGDIFSRDQLLKVCYFCTKKLDADVHWQERCLLGVIDLRTVLFILHISRALQEKLHFDVKKKFDCYIQAIWMVIQELEYLSRQRAQLGNNLEKITQFFVTLFYNAEKNITNKNLPKSLVRAIQSIVEKKELDLFSAYDRTIRKRIFSSLYRS